MIIECAVTHDSNFRLLAFFSDRIIDVNRRMYSSLSILFGSIGIVASQTIRDKKDKQTLLLDKENILKKDKSARFFDIQDVDEIHFIFKNGNCITSRTMIYRWVRFSIRGERIEYRFLDKKKFDESYQLTSKAYKNKVKLIERK